VGLTAPFSGQVTSLDGYLRMAALGHHGLFGTRSMRSRQMPLIPWLRLN